MGVRSPGGPIEAPLIGREAALEEFRETLTVEGAALLCFYGEHGVGISRLLKEIAREARERGCATAHLDLAECRTPLQPGEGVVGQMSPFSRWARMRHFTFVQEELARHWPLVARELPFAAGGRALQPARTALPGLVHVSAMPALGYVWGHTGRRAMRLVARRNLERRLQAGSGLQVRLAEGRMSADRLLELAPLALALDLDDLTRRGRGFMRLVVVYDDHDSYGESLAVRRHGEQARDFVLALARELDRLGSRVTIVVGRRARLQASRELPDQRVRPDLQGADRSHLLRQVKLEKLSPEQAALLLEKLGVTSELAPGIAKSADGLPALLVDLARHGIPMTPPSVDRSLTVAHHILERCAPEDRRLLGLASTVRVFNLALLSDLAGQPVGASWVELGISRGLIEPVGGSTAEGPYWSLAPAIRGALFSALAAGPDRAIFEEGHRRALDHLAALSESGDPEDRFARDLERLYHRAALSPGTGVDAMLDLADQAMRAYRVDRCQQVVDAIEDLHGLAREKGPTLTARLLMDLGGFDAAQTILDTEAERHPLDGGFDAPAVAIELHLAELECARGAPRRSLARYEALQKAALVAQNGAVARYCAWRISLLHYELREPWMALKSLDVAETASSVLRWSGAEVEEAQARRFGVRRLPARPAHMRRHRARLCLMLGDRRMARRCLEQAREVYRETGDQRSLAYADVLRADIVRAEGDPPAAARLAASVRQDAKQRDQPDERLYLHALRSEVQAEAAAGGHLEHLARVLLAAYRDVDRVAELAARFVRGAGESTEHELVRAMVAWLESGEPMPPIRPEDE